MIGNYFWGGAAAAPYEIEQSLRFNSADNAYLEESSIGVTTTCTISWWHKKAAGSTSNTHWYIGSYPSGWTFESTDTSSNGWTCLNGGGSLPGPSGSKYRDYSAWHHWVFTQNGTTSTMWLNGVKVKEDTSNSGSSKTGWRIGEDSTGANNLNGYMAEFIFLDGTAVSDPDGVLGEFDANGVWRPIEYTGGNYGTDGFYLKFDPSATNGIGHDHSGNGNNFTANNFTTSGTGTDVMSDTPTKNWCTLNPTAKAIDTGSLPYGKLELSNGNLDLNGEFGNVIGTIGVTEGKWYWEVQAGEGIMAGVSDKAQVTSSSNTPGSSGWSRSAAWNVYYANNVANSGYTVGSPTLSAATSSSDIIGVALDMDAGEVRYYKNGTVQNSGNAVISGVTGIAFPIFRGARSGVRSVNFGQRDFAYTPPTGFKALNTSNLPAPDIADGSDYFNTVLYTGNGSTQSITGVGFQPDFLWIKNRGAAVNHQLHDAVRGASVGLNSNNTNAEYTDANAVTSFDSTGWSMNNNYNSHNQSSVAYVAWNWLAGNGTSSNTAGSITSTVSVNATAGFSTVSYTGNNTAGATVGHGLGVSPSMMIIKNRDNSAGRWIVYHGALGGTKYIRLDSNTTVVTDSTIFNNTAPSSTTFTLGTNYYVNGNTEDIIAYCFAEVEGYSKFGSYSGNGSSDGPFIYTGFKPAWLMVKKDAGSTDWKIYDAERDPYNEVSARLAANATSAELSGNAQEIDFVSNGFKFRGTNGDQNSSGTFYYVAFASHPFGGDGVSPATAR
jgi:hypothetical protein